MTDPDVHTVASQKGVLNFVQYKFSHLAPKERQTMFELSKMFLLCLNYWKLETPTQYRQRTQKDDGTAYKVDYTRCGSSVGPNCLEIVNLVFERP